MPREACVTKCRTETRTREITVNRCVPDKRTREVNYTMMVPIQKTATYSVCTSDCVSETKTKHFFGRGRAAMRQGASARWVTRPPATVRTDRIAGISSSGQVK